MKYTQHPVSPKTGWTPWIKPVKRGYRIKCCACSLAHELQFDTLPNKRVVYRARRVVR